MIYTAILRRNFRDTDSTKPMVLLTKVTNENGQMYRDDGHCHINRSYVESILPIETAKILSYAIITFEAIESSYIKKGSITSTTLKDLKILKVKYINKKKAKPSSTGRSKKVKKPKKASKTIMV